MACSKSARRRVGHGESLVISKKWKYANTPKKSGAKQIHDGGEDGCTSAPVDPIVRFHSEPGNVEGLLKKYICLIPAPLLRIPAANANPVGIINC